MELLSHERRIPPGRRRNAIAAAVVAWAVVQPLTSDAGGRKFDFEHFSVVAPAGKNWRLDERDPVRQRLQFTKKMGQSSAFILEVGLVPVNVDSVKALEAWKVADDFRTQELRFMEAAMGRGEYSLLDVTRGVETIGDKTFYTLSYVQKTVVFVNQATLYLHFPKPAGNDWFILALFMEATAHGWTPSSAEREEARKALASLVPH